MTIPFEEEEYHFIGDIKRCPYVIWTDEEIEWSRKENLRTHLNALDRYADHITWLHNQKPIWIERDNK
jgi:hypothetical protein